MLNSSFPPWPSFDEEEASAVSRILLSNQVNYWTGQECRKFEAEFAEWVGCEKAIALANGTVALDLALMGLGIGARNNGESHDEVITTPRTFLASASSIVTAGATPIFADVDRYSGNISAETISRVITPNTKAIIVVHLAGWPSDMDPIMQQANDNDLAVIEDCAQAHGAKYKGRSVGSIGHVGAWSFCQDKIMTTGGEGGMVTTNDHDLWYKMWSYKDHGKNWDAVYERSHPPGYRWLHDSFGTNWRMMEMQAAIGRIQISRMKDWSRLRSRNANLMRDGLLPFAGEDGPIRVPEFRCSCNRNNADDEGCRHGYYKYYAFVRPENLAHGWTRDRIVEEINSRSVPCFQGSCSEIYLEKAFDRTDWRPKSRLPMAKELGETSIGFLVHPTIDETTMNNAIAIVQDVLRQAVRAAR